MTNYVWQKDYDLTCGLEVHIQLNTQSKVFSSDKNSFGDAPNANVGIVTAGLPGSLPKLNKEVIDKAILLGLACNCKINKNSFFERKHYFYPDLPKGYQITQLKEPICLGGELRIKSIGKERIIDFHHVHIEEDAGKSLHDLEENYSHVDLNRAGAPLLELVTNPVFIDPDEIHSFLSELRTLVRFLNISDGDMEKGSLRCDANVSLKPKGSSQLGDRTEIKNLNSMNFAKKAVIAEATRQFEFVKRGESIDMQTMGYDVEGDFTFALREKEMAHDYRYFPDPDLLTVILDDEYINSLNKSMPELPQQLSNRLRREYGLSEYVTEILIKDLDMVAYFETVVTDQKDYTAVANWLIGDIKAWMNESDKSINDFPVFPENIGALISLINDGKLSKTLANAQVFPSMLANPGLSPQQIMKNKNLGAVDDPKEISSLVEEVLSAYPEKVNAYKSGKKRLIGFFIGEIMKKSQMKADPKKVADIARRMLDS